MFGVLFSVALIYVAEGFEHICSNTVKSNVSNPNVHSKVCRISFKKINERCGIQHSRPQKVATEKEHPVSAVNLQ